MRAVGLDPFPDFIRKAPYLFSILNDILLECKFNSERERNIDSFAKLFMSQPLPHGLLPLETHRII